MKNLLILGNGYIGKYLADYLKSDTNVTIFSKSQLEYSNPKILFEYINENQNTNSYENKKFDWVINCSGFTGTPNVDGCEDYKEDCYHHNVTIPLQITKVCNRSNIPVIHIGSGCVYSGYDKIYSEEDTPDFGSDSYESSFYSKTKDAFEKLSRHMDRYIFRIRIPFTGFVESKNYLYKLLKYDNLISKQNSITCVDDLMFFIWKFIRNSQKPEYGVYNVVNKGSVDASDVVQMLKNNGIENPAWKFISIQEANFKVARSNCILSTEKIKEIGMELPDVKESLERCVEEFANYIRANDLMKL
jgi:3,5-epimerase/4-reductase